MKKLSEKISIADWICRDLQEISEGKWGVMIDPTDDLIKVESYFLDDETDRYSGEIVEKIKEIASKFDVPQPIITISEPYKKNIAVDNDKYEVDARNIVINSHIAFVDWEYSEVVLAVISGNFYEVICYDNNYRSIAEKMCKDNKSDSFLIFSDAKYSCVDNETAKRETAFDPKTFIDYFIFLGQLKWSFDENRRIEKKNRHKYRGIDWKKPHALAKTSQAIMAAYEILKDGRKYIPNGNNGCTGDKMMMLLEDVIRLDIDLQLIVDFKAFIGNLWDGEFDDVKGIFKKDYFVRLDMIEYSDFGILGRAMSLFLKNDMKPDILNPYLGVVGQRHHFPWLKIVGCKSGVGQYGPWVLWFMEDKNGRRVDKFGDIDPKHKDGGGDNLLVGDVVSFDAIVKAHEKKGRRTMLGIIF